jgi:glycosyltransferase involved in cell wall biosynthesis
MAKSKSILILGNYPPPFGGVPRHIEYLVPYLVEKGWNVHVLSGGNSGIEYKNGFTIYKPKRLSKVYNLIKAFSGMRKKHFFDFKFIRRKYPRRWLDYIISISFGRQIIEKEHISIISAYNLYSYAPIGAVLSDEYNIPLVVTNFGEIYSMNNFFKRNPDVIKYVCNITRKLLAMSYHCAQSYKLLGLAPDVEVIPYGVDVKIFSTNNDGSKIRYKVGINDSDKVVLFVGRLIKDMGLHTLLEAIPQVLQTNEKIKFIIVGQKGELLPIALQLAKKYKNNIFVMPDVPFKELPSYYAASTIVIAPTQGDRACGSLASIEAMATGKPVIASKVGGIPEIVIDEETGLLIPPDNSSALVEAILRLVKDDALMNKMGMMGRRRVEKYFDERKSDQRIEEFLREVVGL